jgi:hypothetical protein
MLDQKSTEDMLATLRNPRWALEGPTTDLSPIALDCMQYGVAGIFVAHPSDPEPHGVETWNKAMAGDYGPIGPYVAPPETVNQATTRQVVDVQTYMQQAMMPREPGPDRQVIYTELQAAATTQGWHFSQIPQPWNRPLAEADQANLDAGLQAFKDTIDYLNTQLAGRVVLPPLKVKEK